MGSIIVNYYRKTKPEDTFIPHVRRKPLTSFRSE